MHCKPLTNFKRLWIVVLATGLLAAAGCQRYAPQPLSASALDDRLRVPSDDALRVRVTDLHHPLLPPVRLHPDQGLTPDEAAVVAVLVNPDLRPPATPAPLPPPPCSRPGCCPTRSWGSSPTSSTAPASRRGTFNPYGLTLTWDFEQLISHGAKVNAAELSAASVDLSVAWAEWQTAEAAKQAVYDLVAARGQLAVLEEIDGRLQENDRTVRQAAGAGLQTAVDLAAAEAAARDGRAAVLQGRRDVEHQWLQLARAMGLPPGDRPRLRDGLTLASTFDVPDPDVLTADIDRRRIDLVALRRGYDSQEQTLQAAVLDSSRR